MTEESFNIQKVEIKDYDQKLEVYMFDRKLKMGPPTYDAETVKQSLKEFCNKHKISDDIALRECCRYLKNKANI